MRPSLLAALVTVSFIGVGCSGGSSFAGSQPSGAGANSLGGATASGGAPAAEGGSGSGGSPEGTGGGTGYDSLTCAQLVTAYATELATAKMCTGNTTAEVCTKQVPQGAIPCGCPTYVNVGRTAAIANLQKIADTYTAKQCATACPAIACLTPTGASCSSSGSGSATRCVDTTATPAGAATTN